MSRSAVSGAVQTLLAALGLPALVVLVKFETSGIAVCNAARDTSFGGTTYTGLGADGISLDGVGETLGGEVPAASLTIRDLGVAYMGTMLADGFRGDIATVSIGYMSSGVVTATGWETTYAVDADSLGEDSVTLRLGSSDAVEGSEVPRRTTQESGCQNDYKRGLCSYRGSLATCDKSLDGPNGCRVHFPDIQYADTDGTRTLTPSRPFGGFPGSFPHSLVRRA